MSRDERALDTFHRTRRETLQLVGDLTQEQLDFEPAPGKWTISEVLDHLTRVDRIFRRELAELVERGRQGTPVFLVRTLSDFGFTLPMVPKALTPLFDLPLAFFSVAVPRPLRQAITRLRAVPTRAPKVIEPQRGRAAGELRAELEEMLAFTEELFAANPDLDFRELYYYNPLTAFTTPLGILSFTASHESRHQEQIGDILATPGMPPGAPDGA